MKLQTIIIAILLTSSAYADGLLIELLPPPPVLEWHQPLTFPRHITRNGETFFCPYAEYDPWCVEPNDYSWNLEGPPWNRRPSGEPPYVPFAATTRWPPGWNAERAMEESRERVIELGEAHCREFPQDTICHRSRAHQ